MERKEARLLCSYRSSRFWLASIHLREAEVEISTLKRTPLQGESNLSEHGMGSLVLRISLGSTTALTVLGGSTARNITLGSLRGSHQKPD